MPPSNAWPPAIPGRSCLLPRRTEGAMQTHRNSLAALAALTLAVLACDAATGFLTRPETAGPTATTEIPVQAAETTPATGEASPTPRRLELPPTPTPFTVGEDDPRSQLDLAHPDHIDYFDNPVAWFDYDTAGRAASIVEDGAL